MTKQENEEKCILLAIHNVPELKGFRIEEKRERPDFVLKNDEGEIIGVEHFLVDTLLEEKHQSNKAPADSPPKYLSVHRKADGRFKKIYEKYQGEKINDHELEALGEIEPVLNDILKGETDFSYESFLREFFRIFMEHAKNIMVYRDNLSSSPDGTPAKLGFLCEVSVNSNGCLWDLYDNGKCWHQQLSGVPITHDMWLIIRVFLLLGFIDFFILATVPAFSEKGAECICLKKDSKLRTYDMFACHNAGVPVQANLHLS